MEDTKLKLYRTAFFWGLPTFFECTSVLRGGCANCVVPFMLKRELRTLDTPYSGFSVL